MGAIGERRHNGFNGVGIDYPVLKNLIFLEILIVIGSILFHLASTRATRREIGHLPGIILGSMAAIGFLAPKLIIAHVAVALIPLILGRTKLKVGMILAMGLFALPPLQTDMVIGGAYLFPWTIQCTLGTSALIAFLIAPGNIPRAPPWADAAMYLVMAVFYAVSKRSWTDESHVVSCSANCFRSIVHSCSG